MEIKEHIRSAREYSELIQGRRKLAMYGSNITFLSNYIFNNPGCTSSEARKALCLNNGINWTTGTKMRGQYTSYFCSGWIGGPHKWPRNPLGRYWKRMKRPDGKTGHLLTLEGLSKVSA
jgi:hypothetical protein|tara:strand:- start:914 stop:1270 length:357 start_codon:yes stop_codon:yes gene_type:complete